MQTLPNTMTPEVRTTIAKMAYESIRAYSELLGEPLAPHWEGTTEEEHEIVLNGVDFLSDNPDVPFFAQHENWVAQKTKWGWVYGEMKDEAAKTDPAMVPFDQLTNEYRLKGNLLRAIFLMVVNTFLRTDE